MKSILSILNKIILIALIGAAGFLGLRFSKNITQVYPIPYLNSPIPAEEIAKAEAADIILIGDSSTHELSKVMNDFIHATASQFKKPLTVYDWGSRAEPMGLTYRKVKSLRSKPLLFIYHGGREELLYQRFPLASFSTVQKNIELTKNDTILSIIMAYPALSRFIYFPHKKFNISKTSKLYPTDLPPKASMDILNILYEIYSMEAKQLFSYLKEIDAKAWVIPQALNIQQEPHRVCENTIDQEQIKTIEKARAHAKEGRYKDAFNELNESVKVNKGNALLYYETAQMLMKLGNFSEARKAFYQAMIYDCGLKDSNPIFLKILMEQAELRQFHVIDFNRMVTNNLGHNVLFLDEETPQPLYYQYLNEKIIKDFLRFIKEGL